MPSRLAPGLDDHLALRLSVSFVLLVVQLGRLPPVSVAVLLLVAHASHRLLHSFAHHGPRSFIDRAMTCFLDDGAVLHRFLTALIQGLVGAHAISHFLVHISDVLL